MSAMTLMIGDAIRRLTANYTEEEYKAYLSENHEPTAHRISWCEGLKCFVDLDANAEKWYYAPKLNYTSLKDIVCDLQRVSDETGYELSFLCELVEEGVQDGETYEEAVEHVAAVSYEHDW